MRKMLDVYGILLIVVMVSMFVTLGCFRADKSKVDKTTKTVKVKVSNYTLKHYSNHGKLISVYRNLEYYRISSDENCIYGFLKRREDATISACGGIRAVEKQ